MIANRQIDVILDALILAQAHHLLVKYNRDHLNCKTTFDGLRYVQAYGATPVQLFMHHIATFEMLANDDIMTRLEQRIINLFEQ